MRHVWTDVHQMGNAVTALVFCIALKQFANLKEQHDKDCLGKLCFCTRKKTDAKGSDGSYRHQEMLVKGVAMSHALGSFLQGVVTYHQIRYKINQQQLPCGQVEMVFNENSSQQQYNGDCDE